MDGRDDDGGSGGVDSLVVVVVVDDDGSNGCGDACNVAGNLVGDSNDGW